MNINFKHINIENFRSIEKTSIDLDNQGIVVVQGYNNYENNATSNGSGKSSVFEAIVYALYEETSIGEKDVANRINNNGYSITLDFSVDDINYTIKREKTNNKTTALLYKNDVDISARNKTDTNKLITDIVGINKDLFLDSIFLTQTANTSLSSLSPTARKERLEILTNIDNTVNEFKEQIKNKQLEFEEKSQNEILEGGKIEGKKEALEEQEQQTKEVIEEIDKQLKERDLLGNIEDINKDIENTNKEIEETTQKINELDKEIENINKEKEKENNIIDEKEQEQNNIEEGINQKENEKRDIEKEKQEKEKELERYNTNIEHYIEQIEEIKKSDTCPTCRKKI